MRLRLSGPAIFILPCEAEGDHAQRGGGARRGTANDIAILWPPKGGPLLAAAFLCQSTVPGAERDGALADVGRVIAGAFARG